MCISPLFSSPSMSLVTPSSGVRSAGGVFRSLIASAGSGATRQPIQLLGAVNPYCAMLAEKAGAKAIYISGSGIATASYGLPDLGITTLDNVVEDVKRITAATTLPVVVDIDTGFGSAFNIARTVRQQKREKASPVRRVVARDFISLSDPPPSSPVCLPHRFVSWSVPVLHAFTSRIRSLPSVAVIVLTSRSCHSKRWSIASRRL